MVHYLQEPKWRFHMENLLNLSENNTSWICEFLTALHLCQCTTPTRFQLLTTANENRNVWEQCYDNERSYLRQMSKRAWITTLALFGLFFRNSHATVFYKEDRPYKCSILHFTIELDTTSHGKHRNATIMLWKMIHRYRHAKHLSLTPPHAARSHIH